jgi:ribonuclease P protein component
VWSFSNYRKNQWLQMKFSQSLKKNKDFQKVYQEGTSLANRQFVMYVLKNGTDQNRLGISVSKKIGNSVVRHHFCRLVREAYRLHEVSFRRGYDIVVIARNAAKDAGYFEIERAMLHLAGKQHLLS